MVIGSIHQEKGQNSRFEYFKEGKIVKLDQWQEVEILCAKDRSNYQWKEVSVGQTMVEGVALEFPGNQDDHFYAVAVVNGKMYHQVAKLNTQSELMQP